jgi:hypothetical protein
VTVPLIILTFVGAAICLVCLYNIVLNLYPMIVK